MNKKSRAGVRARIADAQVVPFTLNGTLGSYEVEEVNRMFDENPS